MNGIPQFGFIKRFVGMVSGEAMQSAFHFALNVALVQIMSAADYGVFAIILVIGGVGLTYIRAFCAMPVSIWIGRSRSRSRALAYDVSFGSAALVLALLLGMATAWALQAWIGSQALIGGLFVTLWCLRSYVRTAMFALGLQKAATLSDAAFTLTGTSLASVLLYGAGQDKLGPALLALLLANAAGLACALLLGRRKLRVSLGRPVRRRFRALWAQLGWSGISVTTANLQGQGISMLVAGIAGPAAYAPIAAGLVLFVPLRIIATALVNLMQPVLAGHIARGETEKMWHQAKTWTLLMGAGSFAYGAGMMFVVPHLKMRVFEGAPLQMIAFCCWAIYSATMLYVMPRLIMEAAGAFRLIAIITAGSAAIGMVLVTLALMLAPPAWSLLGAFASEMLVLGACWISLARLMPPGKSSLRNISPSSFRASMPAANR